MRRLILMRHGEAERPAPGLEDFDRALDEDGRAESRRLGRALVKADLVPDLALVSASRRTLETWRAVAEALPPGIEVESDRRLYAASASQIAQAVAEAAPRAKVIMVVGHNPGIHQYAIHLARQADVAHSPLYEKFATGSAAVFAMDKAGRPELERLLTAKELRDKVR
jgi:phosphohistidine phosphatase